MAQKSHAGSLDNIAVRHRISTRAEGDVFSPHYFRPGAHNDIESGRKGRSVKRPRKRLKFEKLSHISPVTILSMHMYCCFSVMPLTDFSNVDMPKITGREKISVRKCQSSTPEKKKGWLIPPPVGCVKWLNQRHCLGLSPLVSHSTASLVMGSLAFCLLIVVFHEVSILVRSKNSNRGILKNLLRGHFTLLPFLPLSTSLGAPVETLAWLDQSCT